MSIRQDRQASPDEHSPRLHLGLASKNDSRHPAAAARSCRRVMIWSDAFPPQINGVSVFVEKLAQSLTAQAIEVAFVTLAAGGEPVSSQRIHGADVWRFPFLEMLDDARLDLIQRTIREIAQLKRDFAPDVLHVHSISPSVFFHLQTAAACPLPTLFTLHRGLPLGTGGPETVLGKAIRDADRVSTNSQAMRDDTLARIPEIASRMSVIRYGIERPPIPAAPLPFDPPRLLSVGRLAQEKGIDVAIRALSIVRRRFPQTTLTIAGDGPARTGLQRLVRELELGDAVEFLGWMPPERVLSLMNRGTVFVMPSRWEEAFGLVAIEAAAIGRPVVATRVGGIPEVVIHDETGLLVPKESAAELAAAIVRLLEQPERTADMGRRAQRRIQASFRWDDCVADYRRLYDQVLRQHPAGRSERQSRRPAAA